VQEVVELDLGQVAGTTMVRKGMELDLARLQDYLATVLGMIRGGIGFLNYFLLSCS
jgi:regulator of sirC expression with transglutaminase-like and TPR domain